MASAMLQDYQALLMLITANLYLSFPTYPFVHLRRQMVFKEHS